MKEVHLHQRWVRESVLCLVRVSKQRSSIPRLSSHEESGVFVQEAGENNCLMCGGEQRLLCLSLLRLPSCDEIGVALNAGEEKCLASSEGGKRSLILRLLRSSSCEESGTFV